MSFLCLSRSLIVALLLVGGATEAAWAQSARAMQLKQQDPQGLILTLTAVLVVFSSLLMLVFVFRGVGKLLQSLHQRKIDQAQGLAQTKIVPQTTGSSLSGEAVVALSLALETELEARRGEVMAAIAMALRAELEQQHDAESYVLTIDRRSTQWHARSQSMRRFNY